MTKSIPKTSDLVTVTMLGKEFGHHSSTIAIWLEDAKLVPEISMPYGRGFMRMYDPGPAREAVRAKMPKPAATPAPAVPAAQTVDLGVLEERVEGLANQVEKLQEQNRTLFAFIRDHVSTPLEKLVTELGGTA